MDLVSQTPRPFVVGVDPCLLKNRLFRDSGDCSETVSGRTLLDPGPEGLFGDSLETPSGSPGPPGPGDSRKGPAGLRS